MVVHLPSEDPKRASHHDAKELFDTHGDPRTVRSELEERHGPAEATDALHRFDEKHTSFKREDVAHNSASLSVKETLERIAFGLGNLQLLNVLLITVIPNIMLAGIVLAVRSVVTGLVESGYASFTGKFDVEKMRSFWYGNLLGYSFILSAFFITLADFVQGPIFTWLFGLAFLSIGITGALYLQSGLRLKTGSINKTRMTHYLKWISYYGIVLVAIVFLAAGFILDLFAEPIVIIVGDMPLFIYGYAVLLFATGILVLVSAYLSTRLRRIRPIVSGSGGLAALCRSIRNSLGSTLAEGSFAKSLLIAGTLFYSAQLALNYYLGIHLYLHFDRAFTPVAVLFAATLITMFVVPLFFDKRTLKLNGRSSLFFFGTGLALFIPLAFALVHLPAVRTALIIGLVPVTVFAEVAVDFLPMVYLLIGIAGSSIAGIAFSRLALDTMKPGVREHFMRSLGLLTPILSGVLIAIVFGLRALTQSPLASFVALTIVFLATIIIFASLIANRLEQRFEQQAFAPHKV